MLATPACGGVAGAGFAGGVDGDAGAGAWASATAAASSASVYWKGVVKVPSCEVVAAGFVDLGEVGASFALLRA